MDCLFNSYLNKKTKAATLLFIVTKLRWETYLSAYESMFTGVGFQI